MASAVSCKAYTKNARPMATATSGPLSQSSKVDFYQHTANTVVRVRLLVLARARRTASSTANDVRLLDLAVDLRVRIVFIVQTTLSGRAKNCNSLQHTYPTDSALVWYSANPVAFEAPPSPRYSAVLEQQQRHRFFLQAAAEPTDCSQTSHS
jgi:hypothetical protein